MIKARTAKFQIGQIVRHRIFSFRGVIFDIDPEFNNTEEWWLSIPEDVRPHKDQPFYHLLAENSESEYVAYVSEQNLLPDEFRRADPAFAGRRDLREGQIGRLSPAQSVAELGVSSEVSVREEMRQRRIEPPFRLIERRLSRFAGFPQTRKALDRAPLFPTRPALFTSQPDWPEQRRRAGLASSFLRALLGAFLQLFLQLLLGFLEHLRIGRRAVIGLGETPPPQRQRQRQRRAVGIDRLHHQVLPLLHVREQFRGHLVIRHAAIGEADHIGALLRRIAVDDHAGAVNQLHAQRQRDAQDLLRLAFGLDDDGGDDGLAGLDAAILAGEANLLGVGVLTLQAEFGPRRIDQLNLLFRGLAARRWRRRRGAAVPPAGRPVRARRERLSAQPSARLGLRRSGGAGRRRLSLRVGGQQRRRSMPLPPTRRKPAHAAGPTRPRYGNSLRKTLSERERPKPLQAPTPSRLGGCLLAN